jgi:hypothetical protein
VELRALVGFEVDDGGHVDDLLLGVAADQLGQQPLDLAAGRGTKAEGGRHGEEGCQLGHHAREALVDPVGPQDGGEELATEQELDGHSQAGNDLQGEGHAQLPGSGPAHQA